MPPLMRHLVLVLGDQLDGDSSAFDGFDAARDVVWMAEVAEESEHVWTSQPRIAVFLSAMRHCRDLLRHEKRLAANLRMSLQRKNLARPPATDELALN